ncbi:MAG: putative ABC transporter permease YknZ [Microgenomates bacterium OLB22]|nr:MAG: putative ABC transporter permease YknZ [Microgenomates bacterium OLB22]
MEVYLLLEKLKKKSRSIVIGNALATALFTLPEKAVGRTITLDDQRFRVMGVLKKIGGGGFGGPNFDSFAYIPYTAAYTFNPDKTFFTIYIKARSEDTLKQTQREAEMMLGRRYDEDDFSVIEQTEILNAVNSIFSALNSVLVVIGAISLIVGGIGIMNIMYVSVVERTKEIGIRRALGATKQDILQQFLVESVMLSLLGGVGGLIISGIFCPHYAQLFFQLRSLFSQYYLPREFRHSLVSPLVSSQPVRQPTSHLLKQFGLNKKSALSLKDSTYRFKSIKSICFDRTILTLWYLGMYG